MCVCVCVCVCVCAKINRGVCCQAYTDASVPIIATGQHYHRGTTHGEGLNRSNISLAYKERLGGVVMSAAECISLVLKQHPTASAAEYSNIGENSCSAVFGASGVLFDEKVQTCIFEGGPGGLRRLGDDGDGHAPAEDCGAARQGVAEITAEMEKLRSDVAAMSVAHSAELGQMKAMLAELLKRGV